jgi:flagellar hook protein FlgE
MVGALWTGISGLASQQRALDNESNNIANVNTVGYKASRISFADQMYQDRIGKGSKILDSEKLYTQGNLKPTGVDYDLALSGEGFFVVKNTRLSGSSEEQYTRAGNFRMGDNGTLQDAAGNEVQGWPMVAVDTANDVTSTNPNTTMFNDEYTKLLGTKIIKHSTYVDTITARATDYTQTAKSDSLTIFDGAGYKTKSSKISDIEEAIKDYTTWLQRLSEEPDGSSATSTAQVSQINFKSGTNGLLANEGQQVYVTIDGNKISQNYVAVTADSDFITNFVNTSVDTGAASAAGTTITINSADNLTRYEVTVDGETVFYDAGIGESVDDIRAGLQDAINQNPTITGSYTLTNTTNTITLSGGTVSAASYASTLDIEYDVAASRIATYKGLANEIMEKVKGVKAYLAEETSGGTDGDFLEEGESYTLNTKDYDEMLKGIIQIESLIPGKEFKISEVGEISGNTTNLGDFQTTVNAVAGSGLGALESSKEALSRLITGNQRDVYTASDLGLDGTTVQDFTYGISIYDKELGKNIPVPGFTNATPPETPFNIFLDGVTSVDDIVSYINGDQPYKYISDVDSTVQTTSSFVLSDYIKASNINGALVIETLDSNYDVEFNGSLKISSDQTADDGTADLTATYTPIDKNSDYSGRAGAGAEFIELINTVDQTATKGSLQLRLDTLGISESAFGSISVDAAGLVTMTQDGADFVIGQIAIALFNNNRGLTPIGDNLLAKSNNSGDPIYNLNNNKTARVESQQLELSNADLSESLVNLMVFQRAFEANAKSITTSDTILNTLINLKR